MYSDTANSSTEGTTAYRACDVNALLEGDTRPKVVSWCGLCQAWICADCRRDWVRRMQAFLARRKRA